MRGPCCRCLEVKEMDKGLAQEFATKYREFGSWFNDMTELTLRVDSPEVAKSLRRTLGEMSLALDGALLLPLKKEHADLFEDC
jgi:hypothetical protein